MFHLEIEFNSGKDTSSLSFMNEKGLGIKTERVESCCRRLSFLPA